MRHIRQGYASPYARGCHASARANSPNGLRGEKVLVYTSLYFYSRFAVLPGSGAMINGRRGIPGGAVAGVASSHKGGIRIELFCASILKKWPEILMGAGCPGKSIGEAVNPCMTAQSMSAPGGRYTGYRFRLLHHMEAIEGDFLNRIG